MSVELKSFESLTEYLEETAAAFDAGMIDASAVKTRLSLVAEARQVVQDKARFGEALLKLKNIVQPQGLVKKDGQAIVGEPPMFRVPVLGNIQS